MVTVNNNYALRVCIICFEYQYCTLVTIVVNIDSYNNTLPNAQQLWIQYIGMGTGGLYHTESNQCLLNEVQKELQCTCHTEMVVKSSFTML